VNAQVRALREILAQQPVGILVRAALPWTVRIAEVDRGTPTCRQVNCEIARSQSVATCNPLSDHALVRCAGLNDAPPPKETQQPPLADASPSSRCPLSQPGSHTWSWLHYCWPGCCWTRGLSLPQHQSAISPAYPRCIGRTQCRSMRPLQMLPKECVLLLQHGDDLVVLVA
jgi:hypothetical protein